MILVLAVLIVVLLGAPLYAFGAGGNLTSGKIQVVYSSNSGSWFEPGASTTSTNDNVAHDNGTYLLTIPKLISYTEMNIGTVNTSASYPVSVRGVLESGKQVSVTATTAGSVSNSSQISTDSSSITVSVAQGKTTWTADDAYGTVNADGSLSGTNATDTLAMTGIEKQPVFGRVL